MPAVLEGLQCPMCKRSEIEVLDELIQCPECNWQMWREVAHRAFKDGEILALIQDGETKLLSGFTGKNGKSFAAILVLEDGGEVRFKFPPRPEFDSTPLGACPLCGTLDVGVAHQVSQHVGVDAGLRQVGRIGVAQAMRVAAGDVGGEPPEAGCNLIAEERSLVREP